MPSAPANHDSAFSSSNAPPPSDIPANNIGGTPVNFGLGLDQNQIMSLLRSLPNLPPNVFKLAEQGNLKEDAAQTLSNLSQATFPAQHQLPVQQYPGPGPHAMHHPAISDPGPSSHPRGPPNLGQLSAVASAAGVGAMQSSPLMAPRNLGQPTQEMEEMASDGEDGGNQSGPGGGNGGPDSTPPSGSGGRTRGSRSATMGSDEWSRQRKDNHKEVERRRRGNINEGINELGRIVPNGSGEKAKGAILSRAVQYIHHLKENEARNIEKWTLEKLLMDQAMGDLQAQLEEVKRLWEEERMARSRAENELNVLRGMAGRNNGVGQSHQYGSRSQSPDANKESGNREEGQPGILDDRRGELEDGDRLIKRPRLD